MLAIMHLKFSMGQHLSPCSLRLKKFFCVACINLLTHALAMAFLCKSVDSQLHRDHYIASTMAQASPDAFSAVRGVAVQPFFTLHN